MRRPTDAVVCEEGSKVRGIQLITLTQNQREIRVHYGIPEIKLLIITSKTCSFLGPTRSLPYYFLSSAEAKHEIHHCKFALTS